jgi:hypothetical protein
MPAPADVVEPDAAAGAAHQAFCNDFDQLMRSLTPAFAQLVQAQP